MRWVAYAVLFVPAILCGQQTAASDEVRVSSRAYVPASPYTIRVESKLVELNVAVRDGKGRAVRGLKRENFQISDEGKERQIEAFSEEETARGGTSAISVEAPAPAAVSAPAAKAIAAAPAARFVALFFDDINAKDSFDANDLMRTQTAARKFVKEAMQPGVLLGVFTVSGTVTQDFTNDGAKVGEAIGAVKPHPRVAENGEERCPRITPYRAYKIAHDHDRETLNTVMLESRPEMGGCPATRELVVSESEKIWSRVREASTDTLSSIDRVVGRLGEMPGARVIVMASSGFFGQSLEQQQQSLIDHAIHSGVVINALEAKGLYDEAPPFTRPDDPTPQVGKVRMATVYMTAETKALPDRLEVVDSAMADIAHGTGGEFFHNNNDLHTGFRELSIPPEVTYRISFKPEGVTADGSYHKLKVALVHAGSYRVEARPGYFAPAAAENPRTKLDREVAASDTQNDVPAGLAIQVRKPLTNQRTVSVVVRIDVSKLAFEMADGRRKQHITFVSALRDAQGKVVAAKEGSMELALTQETYNRLEKTGLNAELSLQVAPGLYGLREVVQEGTSGKLSSATNQVDLR